jgi:hypothetical protein
VSPVKSIIAVAPIVDDPAAASALFGDALGLGFYRLNNGYLGTEKLDGIRHFGLWPLREAARICFGADRWPSDAPKPQACVEFEVDDVDAVTAELEAAGHQLLKTTGDEPVARFLTAEGLVLVFSQEAPAD